MTSDSSETPGGHAKARYWPLALGAIGVVFGDIGTSPLYAFKEALNQAARGPVGPAEVLGVISLALWALIIVVTIKYVFFLMRADNRGEGGVLSLMALAQQAIGRRTTLLLVLGLCGAALFYGDAVITPAISVLSAIEGLSSVPVIGPKVTTGVVLGITLVILTALFLVQSRGTAKVAKLFGPVCLLWFAVIAGLGVMQIMREPGVIAAFNPLYGLKTLTGHRGVGLLIMGSVFLTVTGAEALYADMGHFGRWPIQSSWIVVVLPALVLNYLGQGALALRTIHNLHGAAFVNQDWFFLLAPEWARIPLVLLAGAATVIASQAVITGAFSLSQQAIQLGLTPRMTILRTSETEAGQIYLPKINYLLLAGVLLLVIFFKTSASLAQAYGLAVTGTMVVTTCLAAVVVRRLWRWSLLATAALVGPLFVLDVFFLGANALKLLSGGWLPLLIGGVLFTAMATWVKGVRLFREKMQAETLPLTDFITSLNPSRLVRVSGTAVFLVADPDLAPSALLHNLKHNRALHARNLIVAVRIADTPRVTDAERLQVEVVSPDFTKVVARFGFMERPNIPRALAPLVKDGLAAKLMETSFFVGKRSLVVGNSKAWPRWQAKLFVQLMKGAADPVAFFQLPAGRVVELGAQTSV